MNKKAGPKIIVALDFSSIDQMRRLVSQLNPEYCRLKIGNILFTRYGPSVVEECHQKGFSVFLDLKFHDIPQTVAGACRSAADLGVWMLNVHVQGGRGMLMAANHALSKVSGQKPLLIGVTVLTSLDDTDLKTMGITEKIETIVPRMAKEAAEVGLDGIVCSAQEASLVRSEIKKDFLLVTPGIRLSSDQAGDQKRTMTPKKAIEAGSDYLVVGRSITQSVQPLKTLEAIHHEIAS